MFSFLLVVVIVLVGFFLYKEVKGASGAGCLLYVAAICIGMFFIEFCKLDFLPSMLLTAFIIVCFLMWANQQGKNNSRKKKSPKNRSMRA